MTPPLSLTLFLPPREFGVCQLPPADAIPPWALTSSFYAIVRTPEELSIVCPAEDIPPQVRAQKGWRALKVQGPLDFSLTGVLNALAHPLAQAEISIFALSTYDTDYLLIPQQAWEDALQVLQKAGHRLKTTGE